MSIISKVDRSIVERFLAELMAERGRTIRVWNGIPKNVELWVDKADEIIDYVSSLLEGEWLFLPESEVDYVDSMADSLNDKVGSYVIGKSNRII